MAKRLEIQNFLKGIKESPLIHMPYEVEDGK